MVEDRWALAIKSTVAGQLHVNTFQYRETFNGGSLSPQQVAIDLAGFMLFEVDLNYKQLMPTSATVDQIDVRGITHPNIGFTELVGDPGTHSGSEVLPPQDAMVISKLTAKFGRSFRGRNYLGGNLEGDQNAGIFVPARIVDAEQFWGNITALFSLTFDLTFALTVYSPTLETDELVDSLRFNTIARGQRRRQLGVGS